MSRRQLFNRAKELGLNVQWATSTSSTLMTLINEELRARLKVDKHASFEEQFDSFCGILETQIAADAARYIMPYDCKSSMLSRRFSKRLSAGVAMYHLTVSTVMGDLSEPAQLATIKEFCILLEGAKYHQSHPSSAIETVTKLREAKKMFLKSKSAVLLQNGLFRNDARDFLTKYFNDWEFSLSDDEISLL